MSLLDDFGDPDRSRRARIIARAAHLLPAALLVTAAVRGLVWFGALPDVSAWATLVTAPLFLLAVIAASGHEQLARMCIHCMARVPADAPLRARRYRALLWLDHRSSWRILLVVIGGLLLEAGLRAALNLDRHTDGWLSAPMDLLLFAIIAAMSLHHRYRPWCPHCPRWDGGGGPREAVPGPVDTSTKTR